MTLVERDPERAERMADFNRSRNEFFALQREHIALGARLDPPCWASAEGLCAHSASRARRPVTDDNLPRARPVNRAKVEPLRRIVGRIDVDEDGKPHFTPKPGHGEVVPPSSPSDDKQGNP